MGQLINNYPLITQILQAITNPGNAISNEVLVPNGTVKQLTSIPLNTKFALISVTSDATTEPVVRYWLDGTDPTASQGLIIINNQTIMISTKQNLGKFKFIQGVAGTHSLSVQYFQ